MDAYEKQIQWFLDHNAPVGGIGCQGHFWDNINLAQVQHSLDRLARFGLPIRITEFDANAPDEETRAKELEGFYRVCFAHPTVDGILMWGFWEGRHWRPEAALWKKDWSPTPAAEAYRRLVLGAWWTNATAMADDTGRCVIRAFHGRQRVEAGGRAVEIDLTADRPEHTVDMRAEHKAQKVASPEIEKGKT